MAKPAQVVRYERSPLYPAQEAAIFAPERYSWVEASTKSGKTHACIVWLTEQAVLNGREGREFWWVAPRYSQAKIAFRRLKQALPVGFYEENITELTLTLLNGATLRFKSGEHPDALYGEDVWAAVVDEASRVKADAWFAVRSTLSATRGPVRLIGNVKGTRNWFYRGARNAEKGATGHHFARLTAYVAVEGGVLAADEIVDARETFPESVFRELYLALPAEDGDSFFASDRIEVVQEPPPWARRARGWDFAGTDGRKGGDRDWSVGVLLAHTDEMTYVVDVRRGRWAPERLLAEVEAASVSDGPDVPVVVEQEPGSSGVIMVDLIKRHLRSVPGTGLVKASPTSGTKEARAFGLATRVNGRRVVLCAGDWHEQFLAELDDFPPDSGHDDQVDAASHAFNFLAGRGRSRVRFSDDLDAELEDLLSEAG
ncbi:MAG: phage terminase large subunit [Microbacteriaceae bacterium]